MDKAKIAQLITERNEEGVVLEIDLTNKNVECAGAKVLSIRMHVGTEEQDGYYFDGDLAVNWSTEGLTNNPAAATMGTLLLHNLNSDDEVTKVMNEFYWAHAFDEQLRGILLDAGFSAEAAQNVYGSEWGMQDEGRASYDAYAIADEVRKAIA